MVILFHVEQYDQVLEEQADFEKIVSTIHRYRGFLPATGHFANASPSLHSGQAQWAKLFRPSGTPGTM
jgi:hypothetical protein